MNPSDSDHSLLRSINAVFNHVGHAVPSIRELLPLYRDTLGGDVVGGGFNEWGGHLAVHFVYPGGGRIELIEPVRADSPAVSRFLERNPRGGLHHLTFDVSDLRSALEQVARGGYETFGALLDDPSWKEAYLHPRSTGGVLIQLTEARPGLPPAFDRSVEEILDQADRRRRETSVARPGVR